MEKIKEVGYDKYKLSEESLYTTKYDNLFKYLVRQRGIDYYKSKKVKDVTFLDNKLSGVVSGTYDYNVSIKYLDDGNIDTSCECEYFKGSNKYCKHVYALLLSKEMSSVFEGLKLIYNNNVNRMKEIKEKFKLLYEENKVYLNNSEVSWGLERLEHFNDYFEWLENTYNINSEHKIIYSVHCSYNYLNKMIAVYNELINIIHYHEEYRKQRDKQIVSDYLKSVRTTGEQKLVDEIRPIKDDEYSLNNYNLSSLRTAINEFRKEGEDVSVLRKVYNTKFKEETDKLEASSDSDDLDFFDVAFLYLLFGDKGLKKLSKKTKKYDPFRDYEPYNFEEEELEEDDYFYEDLD